MESPVIQIKIGLPEAIGATVRYTFSVLLSPYQVEVTWADSHESLERGDIYYGKPLDDSDRKAGVLYIWSEKPRWAAIASRKFVDPELYTYRHDGQTEIPVCFGKPDIGQDGGNLVSAIDLPASAFYWLATYERNGTRDEHGRIPFDAAPQATNKLADKPMVNMYARLLADWLRQMGRPLQQKKWNGHDFAAAVTFDFDNLRKNRWTILFRNLLGWGGKRPKLGTLLAQTVSPGDATQESVRRILQKTAEYELHPTVFLKAVKKPHKRDARDYLDLSFTGDVIQSIEKQSGEIGYHSSYRAALDSELFQDELERLEQKVGRSVEVHRSHYLRFDADQSWGIWRGANISVDSTLGWATQSGFRNACCTPFAGYEPGRKIPSGVIEFPMMAMDVQLFNHMGLKHEEVLQRLTDQIETVRELGGVVVWDFHHHLFDPVDLPGGEKLFEDAIALLKSYRPCLGTLSELKKIYYDDDATDF